MSENTLIRARAGAVALVAAAGCVASLATSVSAEASAAAAPTISVSPATQNAKAGASVRWSVVTRGGTSPATVSINYGNGTGTHAAGSFQVARRFNPCTARSVTYTQRFTVKDAAGRTDTATTRVIVGYSGPICE